MDEFASELMSNVRFIKYIKSLPDVEVDGKPISRWKQWLNMLWEFIMGRTLFKAPKVKVNQYRLIFDHIVEFIETESAFRPTEQFIWWNVKLKERTKTRDSLVNKTKKDHDDANYWDTEEATRFAEDQKSQSELDSLLGDTREKFDRRLEIMQKRYTWTQRKSFEEFVDTLKEGKITSDEAFMSIIKYASNVTNQLWGRYQDILKKVKAGEVKKDDAFTVFQLYQWRDYLTVYDSLDQLRDLTLRDPEAFQHPEVMKVLDNTIARKNHLKELYETEGKFLIAKWLAPYFNGIKRARIDEWERQYRRKVHTEKKGVPFLRK